MYINIYICIYYVWREREREREREAVLDWGHIIIY
jgi:hypothetical protein